MHKIEKLTLIPTIRSEWVKVAFDTSLIDKNGAAAIYFAYKCASLEPPQQILWFDNPHAAINWIALNATELVELIDYSVWTYKLVDCLVDSSISEDVLKIS